MARFRFPVKNQCRQPERELQGSPRDPQTGKNRELSPFWELSWPDSDYSSKINTGSPKESCKGSPGGPNREMREITPLWELSWPDSESPSKINTGSPKESFRGARGAPTRNKSVKSRLSKSPRGQIPITRRTRSTHDLTLCHAWSLHHRTHIQQRSQFLGTLWHGRVS